MRLTVVLAYAALFVVITGALAQTDGEDAIQKHPITAEQFRQATQARWTLVQQSLATIVSLMPPVGWEVARPKCDEVGSVLCQEVGVELTQAPPPQFTELDEQMVRLLIETINLANAIACPCGNEKYDREVKAVITYHQNRLVQLGPLVGGLKPLRANWFGPPTAATPSAPAGRPWQRIPISKWEPTEHAEESSGGVESLVSVKNELVLLNREWQAHMDKTGKLDLGHYGRLLWGLWHEAKMTSPMTPLPPSLQPLRQQGEDAVMAVYWAVCRASQTGEKQTSERATANDQIIALMAAMFGIGL